MRYVYCILSTLVLLAACAEDGDAPTPASDYRDPVIGQYNGTYNQYTWMMGSPAFIFDSTWAYSFSVLKDSSPDKVIANGALYTLDSNLSFYESPSPGQVRSFSFSNDTVTLYSRSGGLGGFSSTTITGKKQ
jgi:hypothetical protein